MEQTDARPSILPVSGETPQPSVSGVTRVNRELRSTAFELFPTGPDTVRVGLGTVNGVIPTLDGVELGNDAQTTLSGSGDKVFALVGVVDVSNATDFGDLLSVTVEVYDAGSVPDSTFENPVLRIGTATLTGGLLEKLVQEVITSVEIMRWFDSYVWLPKK